MVFVIYREGGGRLVSDLEFADAQSAEAAAAALRAGGCTDVTVVFDALAVRAMAFTSPPARPPAVAPRPADA